MKLSVIFVTNKTKINVMKFKSIIMSLAVATMLFTACNDGKKKEAEAKAKKETPVKKTPRKRAPKTSRKKS
ncbi:MAG TPA: hypothetical protein DEG69_00105 [Flavobacteriaceae bacterium]|nr:hypothetical protein [Flavobacteriaceae bacterium]